MSLLAKLESVVNVWAHPDWETATNNNRDRVETVGILNHWDAIQGWPGDAKYLSGNRFGGILYHAVVRRNGQVRLYSQRYVWHAGSGDTQILNVAQNGGPIPDDSPSDPPSVNGNPHFFGVCINYHPDEGPVPDAQYESLVKVNAVLVDHFGLNVGQVARHMDWTARKRDIDTIDLDTFREDVERELMPTAEEIAQAVWSFPSLVGPPGNRIHMQLAVSRATNLAQAIFDLLTVDENTVDEAELDAAVASLIDNLPQAVLDKLTQELTD